MRDFDLRRVLQLLNGFTDATRELVLTVLRVRRAGARVAGVMHGCSATPAAHRPCFGCGVARVAGRARGAAAGTRLRASRVACGAWLPCAMRAPCVWRSTGCAQDVRRQDDAFTQRLYTTTRLGFTQNLRAALEARDGWYRDKLRGVRARHEAQLTVGARLRGGQPTCLTAKPAGWASSRYSGGRLPARGHMWRPCGCMPQP
jgi:hypothetical protein